MTSCSPRSADSQRASRTKTLEPLFSIVWNQSHHGSRIVLVFNIYSPVSLAARIVHPSKDTTYHPKPAWIAYNSVIQSTHQLTRLHRQPRDGETMCCGGCPNYALNGAPSAFSTRGQYEVEKRTAKGEADSFSDMNDEERPSFRKRIGRFLRTYYTP